MNSHRTYQSYLLRLWRDSPQGAWRASAQSTASGEQRLFSDLTALFDFLLTQVPVGVNQDECTPNPSLDHTVGPLP